MLCSMRNDIDHKNANQKYTKSFTTCALRNGRKICYWCCLHISDIADPSRREDAANKHPDYADFIANNTTRDWDECWSVCNRCSK